MRKSQITRIPQNAPLRDQAWMDVDRMTSVEVSSEESDYPIESALSLEGKGGWRAANPGMFLKIPKTAENKNSSFGGHPISSILLARLSARSGILALQTQSGRQKTIPLNSPKSKYLN